MRTLQPDAPAPVRDVLTRDEAAARAERVGRIAYEVALELSAARTTYRGDARLAFPVRGRADLFLDFRGGAVERLEVNGTVVERPERPGSRIVLPGWLLAPETRVHLVYENEYDRNGDGFHRFVDPVDGEVYVYSNFEPFEAHRLFPCFDQPDLKGTLAIRVTVPAAWAVISNQVVETVGEELGLAHSATSGNCMAHMPIIEQANKRLEDRIKESESQGPSATSLSELEEMRSALAFELGAYFGETYIRNHGGQWGWLAAIGNRVFGLRTAAGLSAFPLVQARKRLKGAEQDSLGFIYRYLWRWPETQTRRRGAVS